MNGLKTFLSKPRSVDLAQACGLAQAVVLHDPKACSNILCDTPKGLNLASPSDSLSYLYGPDSAGFDSSVVKGM